MRAETLYRLAADAVLFTHGLFVGFVVLSLVLIFAGKFLSWPWVRNRAFRIVHLVAIGIVVLQSWIGMICPLTTIEMALRARAGDATYAGSFIAHWLESLVYYQAAAWVFAVFYTSFGARVILSWFWVRPRKKRES